jgi:hypothetical protein
MCEIDTVKTIPLFTSLCSLGTNLTVSELDQLLLRYQLLFERYSSCKTESIFTNLSGSIWFSKTMSDSSNGPHLRTWRLMRWKNSFPYHSKITTVLIIIVNTCNYLLNAFFVTGTFQYAALGDGTMIYTHSVLMTLEKLCYLSVPLLTNW